MWKDTKLVEEIYRGGKWFQLRLLKNPRGQYTNMGLFYVYPTGDYAIELDVYYMTAYVRYDKICAGLGRVIMDEEIDKDIYNFLKQK